MTPAKPKVTKAEVDAAIEFMNSNPSPPGYEYLSSEKRIFIRRLMVRGLLIAVAQARARADGGAA